MSIIFVSLACNGTVLGIITVRKKNVARLELVVNWKEKMRGIRVKSIYNRHTGGSGG